MIREDICWEVTIKIVIGLVVITVGGWAFGVFAGFLGGFGVVLGAAVALVALGYGVFSIVKGLWQLIEAATFEVYRRGESTTAGSDSSNSTPADD